MNRATARQEHQPTPSLDSRLEHQATALRERREALLAELEVLNAELSQNDTEDRAYISSLFSQAEQFAKKQRLTQDERASLKVILADLQTAKKESGGLTSFEHNGKESSIDAAIDNVGAWLNESTETITPEEITFTTQITDLVAQAEPYLTKADLTAQDQITLEAIMNNVRAIRDKNLEFSNRSIDTNNGFIVYDSVNDAVGYMAQKLNEAHIKTTDQASLAAIEQQISNMGEDSTSRQEGAQLSPDLQGDVYIADRIANQTNIWIKRTDGTWQQGKATNYSEKDGRVTVAFSTPEGVKMKRPLAVEFLNWQKDAPDLLDLNEIGLKPLDQALLEDTLSEEEHAQVHEQFMRDIAVQTGTAGLRSMPVREAADVLSQRAQSRTIEWPSNTSEFESNVEQARSLWNILIAEQQKIRAIKTGFFGPSAKFEGRPPTEFNASESGLNLSNADKMIAWLNKQGRTSEANLVDAYTDTFVEYQKTVADVTGLGNTAVRTRNVINEARRDIQKGAQQAGKVRPF